MQSGAIGSESCFAGGTHVISKVTQDQGHILWDSGGATIITIEPPEWHLQGGTTDSAKPKVVCAAIEFKTELIIDRRAIIDSDGGSGAAGPRRCNGSR